jgi:hypothetical protein
MPGARGVLHHGSDEGVHGAEGVADAGRHPDAVEGRAGDRQRGQLADRGPLTSPPVRLAAGGQ